MPGLAQYLLITAILDLAEQFVVLVERIHGSFALARALVFIADQRLVRRLQQALSVCVAKPSGIFRRAALTRFASLQRLNHLRSRHLPFLLLRSVSFSLFPAEQAELTVASGDRHELFAGLVHQRSRQGRAAVLGHRLTRHLCVASPNLTEEQLKSEAS